MVGARNRSMVCARDWAAMNEGAFLRVALQWIVSHANGSSLAVRICIMREPGSIQVVHPLVFAFAFAFAFSFFISFPVTFPFRCFALRRWRPLSLSFPLSSVLQMDLAWEVAAIPRPCHAVPKSTLPPETYAVSFLFRCMNYLFFVLGMQLKFWRREELIFETVTDLARDFLGQ